MTDRLDTIRKRLASGSPFGAYGTDLVWALDEIERLTKKANESHAALRTVAHAVGICHCWDYGCEPGPTADIVAAVEDLKRCEIREIDRDAAEIERLEKLAQSAFVLDLHVPMVRAEIARLDALSRATADDPEDDVPCVPCGKVECSCGDARDEMENA